MLFICYSHCSTCKKAQKWLDDHDLDYQFRDIKSDRPNVSELKEWYKKSELPLKKFFNTSGQTYRNLNIKDKLLLMTDEAQLKLLATDGMLVKRPILVLDDKVLVGFNQQVWEERLIDGC